MSWRLENKKNRSNGTHDPASWPVHPRILVSFFLISSCSYTVVLSVVLKLSGDTLRVGICQTAFQTNQEAYFKSLGKTGFYFAFGIVILAAL